ncbi:PcfJ domain-containing protein [Paenibacillus sp. P13VS]|uniref:PcfJ domain-containing protein n=1 Tax=Paenibacillus sp. P13VS TaxID=2697367 RepID=UPI00187BB0CD|nr:PcfJ domain-containing protein [Paenibacillus sp. P13VS]MBE7682046.1 hypothetical protein [Paenibacillus sp. P13VS]
MLRVEFEKHFPEKISTALVKYVTDTVLLKSRYLFYKTAGGIQVAYCTHCQKQHCPEAKLKHKQKELATCPKCGSECEVRSHGMSRKYLFDSAVLIWYEKSIINKEAITARVITVSRDYSGDYTKVETHYNVVHMYLFEPRKSTAYVYGKEKSKVKSPFEKHYGYGSWRKFRDLDNIRKAVKDTPFQYSTWEKYTDSGGYYSINDMVEFFDHYTRYPCIEYLTKAGFSNLVRAKLSGSGTYGAVHWRGKTLPAVLRLTKSELREIKNAGIGIEPKALRYYQKLKSRGEKMNILDALFLGEIEDTFYQTYYREVLSLAPEETVKKYILKQNKKPQYAKRSAGSILSDWRDYRNQCKELGMSLEEERYLFPNDLHEAHMKLTERIKIKKDKAVNKRIKARLPELEHYYFEANGYLIRAAQSSFELFREGKSLSHCVGGYSAQYGSGQCDILFIRKIEQPDEPLCTVEIRSGFIAQVRGFKNYDPDPAILEFVEKFKRARLGKKPKKTNTKKPQGVAV